LGEKVGIDGVDRALVRSVKMSEHVGHGCEVSAKQLVDVHSNTLVVAQAVPVLVDGSSWGLRSGVGSLLNAPG